MKGRVVVGGGLVAVLGYVHHRGLFPTEHEIPHTRAQDHCQTQPHVVGHEYEHEEVADYDLDDMQPCLDGVGKAQHAMPGTEMEHVVLHKEFDKLHNWLLEKLCLHDLTS